MYGGEISGTEDAGAQNGFVDIHAHVLPGIDDGPSNLEDALALLKAAAGCGITTLAATPHVRADFPDVHLSELEGRLQALQEAAERASIEVRLVGGAEVSLAWASEASDDELALASYGRLGRDLLVETPEATIAGLGQLLYRPRSRGFRVTLAHPERNPQFQRDRLQLEELVHQGILLQIDGAVLVEPRRSATQRFAARLCQDGIAHVIASDGHRAASWRPVTVLGDAVAAASALVGPARARWMACEAPAAILTGVALPEPPPVVEAGAGTLRGLFRRR